MRKIFRIAILLWGGIFLQSIAATAQQVNLEEQIQRIANQRKAEVGVAVIRNGTDTITVNNECRYPMMSVFKFHQALAVTDYLRRNNRSLDSLITIGNEELKPDTYSPLRDKYAGNETVSLSVAELLTYTLQLSDNNACDILFHRLVSPQEIDCYIRSLGVTDFSIRMTEDEMHQDLSHCYENWTTPLAAARLFEIFLNRLPADGYRAFVRQTLVTCQTGKDRLFRPLENTGAIIGHKTGTGDRNPRGQIIGINDAGFVILPNGQRYTIAVFVKDSEETPEATAQIIADISETVYRYIQQITLQNETK